MPNLSVNIKNALNDLSLALSKRDVWMALGWNDVKNRYNRSRFGALWASLSILIFVSALGPVYARIMGVELRVYLLHLLLGFAIWSYALAIVMECGREFTNSASYLVSFQLSYFTLLLRVVWRNIVVLAFQMLVFLLFAMLLQTSIGLIWGVIPVALLVVTLNALWMGVLMAVFATRFRDFSELMNNVLRLVFFITPIIWMPSLNADLALIADLNPFFHLIEIFREPLISGTINARSWIISIVMLVVGWGVAFPVFARYRSRIAFWL